MLEKLSPHPNPLPNGDGIVEIKICKQCKSKFEITEKDLEFYDKISPIFEGKKYLIPSPKLCPECRMIQRYSWRNERNLYKRLCSASGRSIVSIYSPDKPYKVFDPEIWSSDKWDAIEYGRDFDFNRSFFEQFNDLMLLTPKISLFVSNNENSDYTNGSQQNKNCYMIFVSDYNENCFFSYGINTCINTIDCLNCYKCELCFDSLDCSNCYSVKYSQSSYDCNNSDFLYDCKNCSYCTFCTGLRNKKFHIFNKEYSKEEYFKKLEEINKDKNKSLNLLNENKKDCINLYCTGNSNLNSVGDYIVGCKNCYGCYDSGNLEDCKNLLFGYDSKNCYDGHVVVDNSELCYFTISTINQYKALFMFNSWYSKNSLYLEHCISCSNCFGCSGLKNKEYCILNKQYTKEEYEKLVPKIIEHMMSFPSQFGRGVRGEGGEWGEFFPISISPFGYNETVANEYFPIESPIVMSPSSSVPQSQPFYHKGTLPPREKGVEQELISSFPLKGGGLRGSFNWSFYEVPFPKVEKIIKAENLPDDISKIPDDILNWAIECEITKKPFRIIKQELEFYRKYNLPIPRRHPDQRHLDRMKLRNPRKLFDRKCDKCGKNIKTTYSTDRKEIIYCESCYEKEVY